MTPRIALLPAALLLLGLAAALLRRPAEPPSSVPRPARPAALRAAPEAPAPAVPTPPAVAPHDAFWGDLTVASARPADRRDAVRALGELPSARARGDVAASATGDVDPNVRRSAIEILGRWQREGDPLAAATASHALRRVAESDSDAGLRAEAVALLLATPPSPPPAPRRRTSFAR